MCLKFQKACQEKEAYIIDPYMNYCFVKNLVGKLCKFMLYALSTTTCHLLDKKKIAKIQGVKWPGYKTCHTVNDKALLQF